MTEAWARDFALDWIAAWNAHDLDRVLDHYAESIEFHSPFVVQVFQQPSGRISGKQTLREYFAKALGAYPKLNFELQNVFTGVNSVTLVYRSVKDLVAAEVMLFDNESRVAAVHAHYSSSE